MNDFSNNIYEFKKSGDYIYKFDPMGNLIFNREATDFSRFYLSLPLLNLNFIEKKIYNFYNIEFEEFIPVTLSIEEEKESEKMQEFNQQMELLKEENKELRESLDLVISSSESNSSVADQMAIKQVILELRKALGQGRVDGDFSEEFPYTPFRKVIT